MKLKHFIYFLIIIFSFAKICFSQQKADIDIFIIDSFVTPEKPYTFNLTFFTSEECKADIIMDEKFELPISENLQLEHSIKIDFMQFNFKQKNVFYSIILKDSLNTILKVEEYQIILPYEEYLETKSGKNPISTILFGLTLYLLPSPDLVIYKGNNYFGITKDLPLITFYSSGYNYPSGNISLEYTHVYNAPLKDFFRLGYKYFIPVSIVEFISPGLSVFTNFNGFNGISPELTLGLFKFYNVFTIYSKYRYNLKPGDNNKYFHEISLGIYSHFFTINL